MRRAAIQTLRTARRSQNARHYLDVRSFTNSPIHHVRRSCLTDLQYPQGQLQSPMQASLQLRNLALFLISSLVASGAWFAYQDKPAEKAVHLHTSTRPSGASSIPLTFSHLSTDTSSAAPQFPASSPPIVEDGPEATQKTLVVQDDQFFTGVAGDQPVSKEIDASGRLVLEMLTPEQATQKLRQNQQSYLVGRGQGVVRYDVVQLASNNPIEDDHVEKIVTVPETVTGSQDGARRSDWMFWGVFDGHSGWTTSAKLRQTLVSFVARELNDTYRNAIADSAAKFPSPEAIDIAIKKGFIKLDNEICHESVQKASRMKSKRMAVELLAPAYSGSCALLSFYDSRTNMFRVACTGDSRAVLGRRGSSGKWTATALSEDQTGGTPSEDIRLRAEHPGEEYVTHKGRILGGLEPSRAFGDAIYKWSRETAMQVKSCCFGKTPSPLLKTPPYVTAEPIITTTKIDPSKGDFVVLATDGLWECLTNEEVVGLVGQWLDQQNSGGKSSSSFSSWFSSSKTSLPVESHTPDAKRSSDDGQRFPIRQQQWDIEGGDERFVVEDKNAATHLIRNALGGKDRDMVSALLSLPSPYSRRYRDDLTVQVIFFGEDTGADGDVLENIEASAPIKAKL